MVGIIREHSKGFLKDGREFEIIDFNTDTCMPGDLDGLMVPIINDIIDEELILFMCII